MVVDLRRTRIYLRHTFVDDRHLTFEALYTVMHAIPYIHLQSRTFMITTYTKTTQYELSLRIEITITFARILQQ